MFDDLRRIAINVKRDSAAYKLIPNGGTPQPSELLISETLSFDRPPSEVKQLAMRTLSDWKVDDGQPELITTWTNLSGGNVENVAGLWDMTEVFGALPNEKCSIVIRYRPNWLDRVLFKLGI